MNNIRILCVYNIMTEINWKEMYAKVVYWQLYVYLLNSLTYWTFASGKGYQEVTIAWTMKVTILNELFLGNYGMWWGEWWKLGEWHDKLPIWWTFMTSSLSSGQPSHVDHKHACCCTPWPSTIIQPTSQTGSQSASHPTNQTGRKSVSQPSSQTTGNQSASHPTN